MIAVIGAGSWGTALAIQLQRSGTPTILWGRNPDQVRAMRDTGFNERFLPGCALDARIRLEEELDAAVKQADHLLIAVPSHAFGETVEALASL